MDCVSEIIYVQMKAKLNETPLFVNYEHNKIVVHGIFNALDWKQLLLFYYCVMLVVLRDKLSQVIYIYQVKSTF